MKTKILLFIMISIIVLSCKKETKGDEKNSNYFLLDGTKYSIDKGYLVDGMIYLCSLGINIVSTDNSTGDPIFNGVGNMFVIAEIDSSNSEYTKIPSGTFTFTHIEGGIVLDYVSDNNWKYHQYFGDQGTCTIQIDGLKYIIDADGILTDNKKLVLKYNGVLVNIIE